VRNEGRCQSGPTAVQIPVLKARHTTEGKGSDLKAFLRRKTRHETLKSGYCQVWSSRCNQIQYFCSGPGSAIIICNQIQDFCSGSGSAIIALHIIGSVMMISYREKKYVWPVLWQSPGYPVHMGQPEH